MRHYLNLIISSLKMTLTEFRSNKLRTFLSLLGITFGIFCIISVLSTISSMEIAVKGELKAFGDHVIFIEKFPQDASPDRPWWVYMKRPVSKYGEMKILQEKIPEAKNIAFLLFANDNIKFKENEFSQANYYGVTENYNKIEQVDIGFGHYLLPNDFDNGKNSIVMGYQIAEELFGNASKAIGKEVRLKNGEPGIVIGVIAKQGKSILDAWEYDHSIIIAYKFIKKMVIQNTASTSIMVQGKELIGINDLKEELRGAMRSVRKLSPGQEDDFALKDIGFVTTKFIDPIISGLNKGGWAIATLSLIVGMFGVANIMFVTVKERTGQIGLKKAVGAKRNIILMEFLMESAFLSLIGGFIGLSFVFILTQLISAVSIFKVFIPFDIVLLAIGICIATGLLAGIVPALQASKLDPVVAIRKN